MKFIVTNKIRGTIVLPSVGYALKPGQMISIAGEQSEATDILIALKRGFLEKYNDEVIKEVKEEVKEEDIGKLDLTKPQEVKLELKKETPDEVDTEEKKSDMMAYNLETKEILNKDDSRKTAMDRISSVDAEPVQIGPMIDFEGEKDIEEKPKPKPRKKAIKKKAKKRTSKKSIKKKIKEVAEKVSKSIKPVGDVKEEPKDSGGEFGFVDEQQERERIERHPVLSKNINEDNSL